MAKRIANPPDKKSSINRNIYGHLGLFVDAPSGMRITADGIGFTLVARSVAAIMVG